MIHRIAFRVRGDEALEFWARRLAKAGIESTIEGDRLRFDDPEGLSLELIAEASGDPPLVARHPEIPEHLALQGFAGVRAFESKRYASSQFLSEALGFPGAGSDSSKSPAHSPRPFVFHHT